MTMTANGHPRNGHPLAVSGPLPVLTPEMGPSSPWPSWPPAGLDRPPQEPPVRASAAPASPWPADGPALAPPQEPAGVTVAEPSPPRPRRWPSWRWPDGDAFIRWSSSLAVLAVSGIAAVISYSHIYALALATHEFGTDARLLPLSVDGLILASSLTLLHAARRDLTAPVMAYLMLALGVGATVAANVEFGLPWGWKASCVAAWPAVAFIGSVEVALRMTRSRARRPADRRQWWPRRRVKAVAAGSADGDGIPVAKAVATPAPAPPAPRQPGPAGPSPGAVTAPSQAVPGPPAAPPPAARKPPPSRPAVKAASRRDASTADGKIASAITAVPSLATATNPALAEAAGVSVTSVERWRKRQRDAGSRGRHPGA